MYGGGAGRAVGREGRVEADKRGKGGVGGGEGLRGGGVEGMDGWVEGE